MSKDIDTPKPSTPVRVTLKAGTDILVNGVKACLVSDVEVEGAQSDYLALRKCSTAGPFEDYPKMLADGYTAQTAEDEASHGVRPNPLKSVAIEMENPAYHEPVKTKTPTKAKE